jgi:hypothetical protein
MRRRRQREPVPIGERPRVRAAVRTVQHHVVCQPHALRLARWARPVDQVGGATDRYLILGRPTVRVHCKLLKCHGAVANLGARRRKHRHRAQHGEPLAAVPLTARRKLVEHAPVIMVAAAVQNDQGNRLGLLENLAEVASPAQETSRAAPEGMPPLVTLGGPGLRSAGLRP